MDVLAAVPMPIYIAVVVVVVHLVILGDCGAGMPIFFPIVKRFMGPFRPTNAYQRIKSKFVI